MIKKLLRILGVITILMLLAGGYLYFRLHNSIENVLDAPDTWRSEVLEFPLLFAGDLKYTGEEHIRFTPGWGETNSDDYFSYVFLWMIEDDIKPNASDLEKIMNTYFDGLMNTGAITNFHFFKKIPKTRSSIKKVNATTLQGSVEIYDEFFANKKIVLNTKINFEYCASNQKRMVWFYLSPKETNHTIWEEFKNINLKIRCD